MLYISEKLHDDHGVNLSEKAQSEIKEFEGGVTDRRNIHASVNIKSPQQIEVTLTTGNEKQKLKQFLESNKKVVERMDCFDVQETTEPTRRRTSFDGKIVLMLNDEY